MKTKRLIVKIILKLMSLTNDYTIEYENLTDDEVNEIINKINKIIINK